MDCLASHGDHGGGGEADRNGIARRCETGKKQRKKEDTEGGVKERRGGGEREGGRAREENLIRVTESECLKMLTTLALLPFREMPFARNEEESEFSRSKEGSRGETKEVPGNTGGARAFFPPEALRDFAFVLRVIAR